MGEHKRIYLLRWADAIKRSFLKRDEGSLPSRIGFSDKYGQNWFMCLFHVFLPHYEVIDSESPKLETC